MKPFVIGTFNQELLGDRVERAVKPLARSLRLDCLDQNGNLKPESGCGKRKARLNAAHERLEDWLRKFLGGKEIAQSRK